MITPVPGALAYPRDCASAGSRQHNRWDFRVYSFPGRARKVPAAQAGPQFGRGRSELVWFQDYFWRTK